MINDCIWLSYFNLPLFAESYTDQNGLVWSDIYPVSVLSYLFVQLLIVDVIYQSQMQGRKSDDACIAAIPPTEKEVSDTDMQDHCSQLNIRYMKQLSRYSPTLCGFLKAAEARRMILDGI